MTTIPTFTTTEPLTPSLLHLRTVNDAGDSLIVYLYQFMPEAEDDPNDPDLTHPRIFAGTATGSGIDLDDPASAIRFGLAIAQAGIQAAQMQRHR